MTMTPPAQVDARPAPEPDLQCRPRIPAGLRLQWEPSQQCHVLLYPEGMVKLNPSAGEILQRCDGQRSVAALITDLEAAFQTTGLQADVLGFLRLAGQQRWLVWS